MKEGGVLEGSESKMVMKINGVSIIFEKNKKDGLYYTKLHRMKVSQTHYCNEIKAHNDQDEKWEVVMSKEKKGWPKMTREEAHTKWRHGYKGQLNTMGFFSKSI